VVICQPSLQMGEELAVENGRIYDFQGLVTLTLTLTLDRVILHTSCITHRPLYLHTKFNGNRRNFFVDGWTDGRKY